MHIPELLCTVSAPLAMSRLSRLIASLTKLYGAGGVWLAIGTIPGDMYDGVYGLPAAAYCVIHAAVIGGGTVGGPSVSYTTDSGCKSMSDTESKASSVKEPKSNATTQQSDAKPHMLEQLKTNALMQ